MSKDRCEVRPQFLLAVRWLQDSDKPVADEPVDRISQISPDSADGYPCAIKLKSGSLCVSSAALQNHIRFGCAGNNCPVGSRKFFAESFPVARTLRGLK